MELIWIILFVYLLVKNNSLTRRIKRIEALLENGTQASSPAISSAPVAPASAPMSQAVPQPIAVNATPAPESAFMNWLKEDWLMKLGALLFIIGFGWFVSYAFIHNWIGPVGRISLGIVAGILIMLFGFRHMLKYPTQGAVFMALGSGMAMLSIFAGRSIYGFFTPATAVAFDFLIAAFVSFASYKLNVKPLAFLAQILAFVAPLLAAGESNSVFLFSYLLLVSLATLFLAAITGWQSLVMSSLIFVGLYSAPYIGAANPAGYYLMSSKFAKDAPIILNFAYIFGALYLVAGLAALIKGKSDIKNSTVLAIFNGLFLLTWIMGAANREWQSLILAAWAVALVLAAFIAYRASSENAPFFAYGSVASAFIAAATAIELSGPALILAYTIEILLVVTLVLAFTKNYHKAANASLLFLAPVLMSLPALSYYGRGEIFSSDFTAILVVALGLTGAGWQLSKYASEKEIGLNLNAGSIWIIIGTFYFWNLLWNTLHIIFRETPDTAVMLALLTYTIFGLVAYFSGLNSGRAKWRTYGAGLLVFVIGRLIFVDVWDMELFGRIVIFLAIGVLLMSTAFITKSKKDKLTQLQ